MQYDFDPAMSSLENAFENATAMGNNNEFNSSPTVMSLKQWMEETRRQLVELNPSAATSSSRSHSDGDLVLQYVKLVLPVALKLVEFLVQAKGEHHVDVDVNINNLAPTAGISEGVATATAHHDDATENPSSCPQGFKSTPSLPYASGSVAMDDCRDSGNSGVFGGHMIEAPLPLSRIHMGAVKVRLSTMTKWQQQQQTHRTQTYSRLPNNLNGVDFSSLTPRDEALLHSEATLPLKFTSDIIAPHCSMAREADHKDQNSRQENPRLLVRNPDSAAEVAIITNSPVDAPAQPFQSLSPFQAKRESQRHSKLCTDAPSNSDCTTYNENTTEYDFDMTTWKQIHLNESKHDKDDSDITSANSSKNLSSFRCGTQQQLGKSDGSEMNWDDFEMGILNEMKEYDNFIGFDQQSDKESDDSASGRNVVVGKGRVLSVFISSNDHDPNPLPKYITDCSGTTIQNNSYYYKNDYGSNTSRLVALGIIFYELFSNQEPPDEMRALLERDKGLTKSVQSMSSLHVGSCDNDRGAASTTGMSSVGTSFKVRRKSSQSVKSCDELSPFILNLELANLPQSICMLVAHLLGCAEIDARDASKDCYKSLEEVQFDLQLMIRDPKYVEDVNGGMLNHFIDENVLYGRDEVISKCETLLEQSRQGECSGVLISGEAGVGKSQLAMRLRQSVLNKGGLFLSGKFDQSKDVIPLSVVAAAFNTTCHEFLERSTQNEKKALTKRLESSLGFQVRTLMALIPNLQRLTMYISENSSIFLPAPPNESCVNVEHQMHFLFYMLLESLSMVLLAPVVCCFDDIQFADPSSLGFTKSLLIYSSRQKNLFFIGCCRDEIGDFSAWLESQESGPTLSRVHLNNLNIDAVNSMLSHELHLTPRLTLPLAEILFHKTLGNPLFLRKLLESLIEEGSLHFSMPRRLWIWNTDRIQRMKVSDGVVELLTKQICTLSKDLQTVLKIASCIGGSIDKSTMDLLLKDAQIRSPAVAISEAVKKGFFIEMESKINFVHDKVQQAAYSLIPQDQREKDHLRFGLALCSSVLQDLNEGNTPDDVFFVAINQINRGASQIAKDPVIAKLNLKAAVCAMKLSDFSSAYNYCVHGVRNLYEDHWQSQYDLSLQLCDQGAQAACALGNVKMVKCLTSKIHANARKYDDELPSLYSTVKTLRESALYEEAKDCSLGVLRNLGEQVDTLMNNDSLVTRMQKTKSMLVILEDAAILSMKQVEEDRVIWTMKFYLELIYTLQHMQSSKMVTISIHMMDMTLNNGLCCTSPLAFAIFGYLIVSLGDPFLGYRMGKLAINLMRKLNLVVDLSSTLTSIVYGLISWAHEPFQSIAEMHLAGHSSGNQSGDVSAAGWNYQQYLILSFVSGEKLPAVKSKALSFAKTQLAQKQKPVAYNALSIYFHSCALMGSCPDKSFQLKEDDILAHAIGTSNSDLQVVYIIHQLMRSYVFKRYEEMAKNANSFHEIANSRKLIRFFFLIGTFYEGLISFSMARRIPGTNDWMERGNAALATLSRWSSFCMHNFENKVLLLKAERNFAMGGVAGTDSLYRHSIDSARQHKFVNEEAIASESAASFYFCNNDTEAAISHLTKARNLYQSWGAVALVEITESKMDPWSMLFGNNNNCK